MCGEYKAVGGVAAVVEDAGEHAEGGVAAEGVEEEVGVAGAV